MTELYKKQKVGYKVICTAGSRKRRWVKAMSVYGRDSDKPLVIDLCLGCEKSFTSTAFHNVQFFDVFDWTVFWLLSCSGGTTPGERRNY